MTELGSIDDRCSISEEVGPKEPWNDANLQKFVAVSNSRKGTTTKLYNTEFIHYENNFHCVPMWRAALLPDESISEAR